MIRPTDPALSEAKEIDNLQKKDNHEEKEICDTMQCNAMPNRCII